MATDPPSKTPPPLLKDALDTCRGGFTAVVVFSFCINLLMLTAPLYIAGTDQKINGILNLIQDHYVDTINRINFTNRAINSILNELDPHSAYINSKK